MNVLSGYLSMSYSTLELADLEPPTRLRGQTPSSISAFAAMAASDVPRTDAPMQKSQTDEDRIEQLAEDPQIFAFRSAQGTSSLPTQTRPQCPYKAGRSRAPSIVRKRTLCGGQPLCGAPGPASATHGSAPGNCRVFCFPPRPSCKTLFDPASN